MLNPKIPACSVNLRNIPPTRPLRRSKKRNWQSNLLKNKELFHSLPMQIQYYDAEETFRGRWNSCMEGSQWLSGDTASEGFIAGTIPEGRWCGILLVPPWYPQKIKVVIQVEAASEILPCDIASPFFYFSDSIEPASDEEEAERRWYIGELHEHTSRSCGNFSSDLTLQAYEQQGFHFLTLSDHDVQPVTAVAKEPNLTVLRGEELESFDGHYMLLGIRKHVRWFQEQSVRHLEYIIHETHAQGGLFGLLHPFAFHSDTGRSLPVDSKNWKLIDFMEIWPGVWEERYPEILKALDLWDSLLNRDIRIMGTLR